MRVLKMVPLLVVSGILALIGSYSYSPKHAAAQSPPPPKTIDDIFTEIAEKVPGFGGAFFSPDPSDHVLLVYFTNPSQEKLDQLAEVVRRDYGDLLPRTGEQPEVSAIQGTYDYTQLRRWYDVARNATIDLDGLVSTDIQEANNRLEFGVDSPLAQNALASTLRSLGIPDSAVSVSVVEAAVPGGSLRDPNRPLTGGLQIQLSNGRVCTLGFQAITNAGVQGFFTDSHCTNRRGQVDYDVVGQPTSPDQVGVESLDPPFWSGTTGCSASTPCRYSDSAFIRLNSGVGIYDGYIARAEVNSPTWNGGLLRINGTGQVLVNNQVFKVGRTTGYTGGQVYATCRDFIDNSGVALSGPVKYLCQDQAAYSQGGGDSGSPVFLCPSAQYPTWDCASGSDVTLVGIHYGVAGGLPTFAEFPLMYYEYGSLDVTAYSGGGGGGGGK